MEDGLFCFLCVLGIEWKPFHQGMNFFLYSSNFCFIIVIHQNFVDQLGYFNAVFFFNTSGGNGRCA